MGKLRQTALQWVIVISSASSIWIQRAGILNVHNIKN